MSKEWGAHQLADWVLSMGHDEIDWLIKQMAELPTNPTIVNIGAAAGVSTIAMLEARADALIYSCEIDPGAGEYVSIERAGLVKASVVRLGESKSAGLDFEWEADFIFVDGGHLKADVIGDIIAWLPHLKVGSIIAFHDYHNRNIPTVSEGVDSLMSDYPVVADVDTIRAYRK